MRRLRASAPKRPSAKHHPGRFRSRLLAAAGVVGLVAVLAAGVWTWRSGLGARMLATTGDVWWQTTKALGLTVADVQVVGRKETPPRDILAALDVGRGTPILTLDPAAARERLLHLGWVKDAHVERRLPDTIFVRLIERQPVAVWQHGGAFALIDAKGEIIGGHGIEHYGHLPLLVGGDAPPHAAALLAMLAAEPDLMAQVKTAIRVGQRRWNIQLANGIEIRLPEVDAALAWRRLAEMNKEQKLFARNIAAVDFRARDRMIVRMRRESGAGEET
ncbi:MAG: cell division protein FtsQ/DivIB [Alphaproteobacteria bacterium]